MHTNARIRKGVGSPTARTLEILLDLVGLSYSSGKNIVAPSNDHAVTWSCSLLLKFRVTMSR